MYTLITGAASARAYQIKKQEQGAVLLGDYKELPALMLQAGNMIQLPSTQNPAYAHLMLTLCLDRQINRIWVLYSDEARLLQEAELLFAEYEIELNYRTDDL